jgi:leader peptidase (prepilin peptidase)/N-methyltransferase
MGEDMNTIKILVISMLGIAGIADLKWKKINIILIIPFLIAGIICNLQFKLLSLTAILGGMAIGIMILLVGAVTQGKIGYGDGIILTVTGLYLGFFDNLFLLLSATFLAAIIGVVLFFIKGVNKNYEMPFIPFVFLAFLGDFVLWS